MITECILFSAPLSLQHPGIIGPESISSLLKLLTSMYLNQGIKFCINNCFVYPSFAQFMHICIFMHRFQPADSKSLRLRSAPFEMQLSHGLWGSPFKHSPSVCTKTVSSLLSESRQMIVYIT